MQQICDVVLWSGAFCGSWGVVQIIIIHENMSSPLYQKILKDNVWPSGCDLKLKYTWVMKHRNGLKYTAKS